MLEEICRLARQEEGVAEEPGGSNRVKYNNWFYGKIVSGSEYPWCMTFMQWLAHVVGLPVPRTAGCTELARWARKQGQWVTGGFRRGDWVEFDFSGQRKITQHVGLVIEAYPDHVVTIEGNTGSASQNNGGQVQCKKRAVSLITGAWRPPYETYERERPAAAKRYQHIGEIPEAFRETIRQLMEIGVISGYGNKETAMEDVTLEISHDMVRILVFGYRGGAYDRALLAAGKPAVISTCSPPGTGTNEPA